MSVFVSCVNVNVNTAARRTLDWTGPLLGTFGPLLVSGMLDGGGAL